jgi:hypothetical protein
MPRIFDPAKLDVAVTAAMKELENILLSSARAEAPRNTGAFAEGLESRLIGNGFESSIEIYSTVEKPLPIWISEGTAPHEIGAPGQFLYNPDEDFAAIGPVLHPGTQPNPFVEDILLTIDTKAQELLLRAIESAIL